MPNPNYEAGRRFEYKIKKEWEKDYKFVMRTAGSHGPFDLIAISEVGGVALIQCKRCQTKAQARRIIDRFKEDPPISGDLGQFIVVYVAETRETLTGAA